MTTYALIKCLRPPAKRRAAGMLAAAAWLAACSGGDGSVGVGSGQDPDPVAVDFPIAYTKGPLFDANMTLLGNTDLRELDRFNVGTDLYLRDRASPSAAERNITLPETQGLGDVRDVQTSADGTRLLFAMRGPFDANLAAEDQPTWNIWEYDIATDALRRIIASDILAEDGHDISPHYLPDGRIIFSSTRQRTAKAVLLDEGKPQFEALDENFNEPASVLHVMEADGTDLHQVSFNQSHDYYPTVLDNGQVLFSRWDRAGNVNGIHLYRMNPDGSALELLYGAESHATGTNGAVVQFVNAHETFDGRVMAIMRPFTHPDLGGDVVIIDTNTYVENAQPNAANPGMTGPAQTSATLNNVTTDLAPSPGGRFSSAFPLWDGTDRVFASWSNCRVVVAMVITACTPENLADPNVVPAPPLYGIWMYDPANQTQLPIVIGEESVFIADVVAAQPRSTPPVIIDLDDGGGGNPDWIAENVGVINIRSVYDIDGVDTAPPSIAELADPAVATAAERPARFVRLVKAVSIPDEDLVDLDDTAFGPDVRQGMREIVGYAPVEPDGSVRIKVPANVALAISVLDANGRRISARHQNWVQVRPGQELRCNGCHDPQSGLSHGNMGSFNAAHIGAQTTGVPFPNTVNTLVPDFGDTMAETRTRVSCQTDCAALEPSFDPVYQDVWTDPAVRAPDADIRYEYAGLSTPPPLPASCMNDWEPGCRSVINYETHIHPLWARVRQTLAADGITVIQDYTCQAAGCHAPPALLDLSDGLSAEQPEHFNSYRELLFGAAPTLSADGAIASDAFFSRFAPGGAHAGYLSDHELRLIAEWVDIGAQYYNNPFSVPVN